MNRLLLMVLLLVVASGTLAQQEVTRLQCDGKFSNYVHNFRDAVEQGGYVEIRKESVKLVSILGFDGVYEIRGSNEARIVFGLESDRLLHGYLNRFSGELSMHKQRAIPVKGAFGGVEMTWKGSCRPAKPMF